MPDDRTQEALDALADLFLTGIEPAAAPTTTAPSPAKSKPKAERSEASGLPRTTRPDVLEGPAPIRLAPKLKPRKSQPFIPAGVFPAIPGASGTLGTGLLNDFDDAPAPTPLASASMSGDTTVDASIDLTEDEALALAEPLVTDPPFLRLRRDDEDTAPASTPESAGVPASAGMSAPPAPITAPVLVEAILLGNLPGVAGPWLAQYAQLLASQEGPVALLHVSDHAIDLDLVEPNAAKPSPLTISGGGVSGVVESLLRREPSPVRTILVHFDADTQTLATPAFRDRLFAIDFWTVLAGADDAAVVSVYSLLKALAGAGDAATKRVGLMVMGSDEAPSRSAAKRVQLAANNLLDQPIQLVGWQKRIAPANLRTLGSFDHPDTAWPALHALFQSLTPPTLEAPELDPGVPASTGMSSPIEVRPPKPDGERSGPAGSSKAPASPTLAPKPTITVAAPPKPRSPIFTGPLPKPRKPTPAPGTPAPGVSTSVGMSTAIRTPPPKPETEPRGETSGSPGSLAPITAVVEEAPDTIKDTTPHATPERSEGADSTADPSTSPDRPAPEHVGAAIAPAPLTPPELAHLIAPHAIPGALALEARCPHHPDTQLVLDDAGRLHLLKRAAPVALGPTRDPQVLNNVAVTNLRAAILDLIETRRWVREYADLLRLTQRQLNIDTDSPPILHLFTDRADLALALITRLGDTLKLHLLQEARVGPHTTWFCTPLS